MNSNNNNKWANNKRDNKQSQRGGKGQYNGRRSNDRRQNKFRSDKGERQFQKFADIDHNKQSNYWPKNDWDCDNTNRPNYDGNGSVASAGIFPWLRNKPANPLIIPHNHINFEQQQYNNQEETPGTNTIKNKQTEPEPVLTQIDKKMDKETTCRNNSVPAINPVSETTESTKLLTETNFSVKIKQEKDLLINLKLEKKSSSSSSSSSTTSSSNEEESEPKVRKTEITSAKPPSSPLNIKLKPKANSMNSAPVKLTQKLDSLPIASPTSSSSSSSSSSSDSEPEPSSDKKEKLESKKKEIETKSSNKKNSSEDDVVCIGKLENKIVLEDDEEETESSDEETARKNSHKKPKKPSKKITTEKCMICDKKGHTSFQCQMICKNCSAPYHGYRTCPQPANLNTMLQLFIEFCMQQLQNFNATSPFENVAKKRAGSTHLISTSNKSNKIKRKAKETKTKTKAPKKRKISSSGTKKNKSKSDSDDSTDDDNDDDDTNSYTSSSEQGEEDISDSSAESLVSSKRKRKLKSKSASKSSLNSVSLPVVLNGFPHLTVPAASIQNPSTSSNALNTLLLTQMFQNAIGSLKK